MQNNFYAPLSKSLFGDEVCLSSQEENQRSWKSAIFAKKR